MYMNRLIIMDLQTMHAPIVSRDQWCADNADDVELVARVCALKPGEGLTIGGGAAPAFAITAVRSAL